MLRSPAEMSRRESREVVLEIKQMVLELAIGRNSGPHGVYVMV
jgi:hypothetical protein